MNAFEDYKWVQGMRYSTLKPSPLILDQIILTRYAEHAWLSNVCSYHAQYYSLPPGPVAQEVRTYFGGFWAAGLRMQGVWWMQPPRMQGVRGRGPPG